MQVTESKSQAAKQAWFMVYTHSGSPRYWKVNRHSDIAWNNWKSISNCYNCRYKQKWLISKNVSGTEIFYKPLLSHPLTFSSPNHSGPCTRPILWFAAQALFSDTSAAWYWWTSPFWFLTNYDHNMWKDQLNEVWKIQAVIFRQKKTFFSHLIATDKVGTCHLCFYLHSVSQFLIHFSENTVQRKDTKINLNAWQF